jgi:alpha-amylase/alpha-mannosidase (GH57 family)
MKGDRCVCIHGHFYQPPRESPWLEEIERQESARPFHDWNERVCHEAYAPNASARILGEDGRIVRIVNNYARMSFNFGPTLLSWLARRAPGTYRAIIEADELSRERFSGHGSAMAQAHGHVILPLASSRDKRTQILWGIRDFVYHFGRRPEGMWLPETAVDLESLDIMAREGIRFTVLAPRQARQARGPGESAWRDVSGERVDPSRPYRVAVPSGGEIVVFFYDGPLSRAVAFEQVLTDGGDFARRLVEAGAGTRGPGALTHIATDGETFGHHHRHGEMALSYALEVLEEDPGIRLTNYSEYLSLHPPVHEATIVEDSSWSCVHGVERWRSDCGCTTGGRVEWRQGWRAPLRHALDWLRDELAPRYEAGAEGLLRDPWGARDRYIGVVVNREWTNAERFLEREAGRALGPEEGVRALQLLELQRHCMLMYTSCGWFFDDLARIETLQVLRYAARALHLSQVLFDDDLEAGFLDRLSLARSNVPAMGTGRDLYLARVLPGRVGLAKVAAHHAVAALFREEAEPPEEEEVYCYSVRAEEERRHRAGTARFTVGRLEAISRITHTRGRFSYAVLHLGDHHLVGGVRPFVSEEAYRRLADELVDAFESGRAMEMAPVLDREFEASTWSLHALFQDEQERVVNRILEASLADAEGVLAGLYESRMALMRFLAGLEVPQPAPFRAVGEFILTTRLERALSEEFPDLEAAELHFREAALTGLRIDRDTVRHAAAGAVERVLAGLSRAPDDPERMEAVLRILEILGSLPFTPDLWAAQNTFFRIQEEGWPRRARRAAEGDGEAVRWVEAIRKIGDALGVAVPELPARV